MLRNREIRLLLLVMIGISAAASVLALLLPAAAPVLVPVLAVLLIGASLFFTFRRYKKLETLSGYLKKISAGDVSLDVRDNEEGELSILKNDIYKVTSMLAEERSGLKQDKTALTEAISDISHQLKTPVTSMVIMADLLRAPELSEEKRREFTNNISVQLERIEWLVSALLKLSKIDAGSIQFKKETVLLKDLIAKALEPLAIPAELKEQSLLVHGEDGASFQGDVNWTAEALMNIVKNGVEHTPAGGTISVTAAENALYSEIVIQDSGDGIPKEDLPYIFQRFYKGRHTGEDSVGIGLALAERIITGQQGNIDVKSRPGEGTTFRITFHKHVF
ncbi:sensor histidine kinase [Alkalicoccus urumqiensis]|uniref:histidine kinase n=1 Tax=Alkalicoccus urumqiensis TaxID=1548213 RepID=A0A2P6MJE6_ALKUR|nr:HAMP domain-containing sensor histidine kinase [Alkalicoccus urumqiensis]PRO66401.1 two-component sensor histidine kinase [Alkalicoccus urumqiensis]